ncbi:alpha/beta fold hydrolase [Rhizobium sp. SG2393]|uniref:alpha/beta fold hydrolase n=1 Tax=Rhizobium sp. SG2393 TaxID=3276279 RepID=UPI003672CF6C
MFSQTQRMTSPTGADLAWHRAEAAGAARGVLLVCHGLSEHSRRYARFADAMAAHGFHVYAHDHRGHGETRAPDAIRGQFAPRGGARKALADVAAMRAMVRAAHPGLPLILFGHSMGGLIALNAAEEEPSGYDGVAVWNSNFNAGLAGRAGQAILAVERALKGSDVPSETLTALTFGAWKKKIADPRTDFDWLSKDAAEVDAYIADPLCGFDATVSLWIDLFALCYGGASQERLARLPKGLPVHLLGGSEDPATNGGRETRWLAERMRAAGLTDVSLSVLNGFRHETLNEVGRDAATEAFAAWARGVAARRSAGGH